MSNLRVALVQLAADQDVAANVERAMELVRRAAVRRPGLIALPEVFHYRGPAAGFRESASTVPGPVTEPFAELARDCGAWILLGSLAERSVDPVRPYNTSVLLDPDGEVAATYRKIHLFDVSIENGPSDRESARITPGSETVVATLTGAASSRDRSEESAAGSAAGSVARGGEDVRLGMSVCFDLRFPELYRDLAAAGAQVLAVPANFTEATGRDHWEVLLRARAIENGAFVIAPAQCGVGGSVPAHGRSMVVDPWGLVLAQAPDGPGLVVADIDLDRVAAVRRQLPTQPRSRPHAVG
jgi:deaminated glutathione amidase